MLSLLRKVLGWIFRYRPKTDAERHAWFYHARESPTIEDIAESLYCRWGSPAQEGVVLGWAPQYSSLHARLVLEALQENHRHGTPREVEVTLDEWHACAIRDAVQSLAHVNPDVAKLIFGD